MGLDGQLGTIGQVYGALVDETGTRRTINYAFANATAGGNTQVVAAQGAGIRIRMVAAAVVSSAAITVKFQSATTDISAGFPVAANGGFVLTENGQGWFQTSANEALNLNLSGVATVGCNIVWIQSS